MDKYILTHQKIIKPIQGQVVHDEQVGREGTYGWQGYWQDSVGGNLIGTVVTCTGWDLGIPAGMIAAQAWSWK